MSKIKVLLTGGTGYLGGHLCHGLLSQNMDVTVLKRSCSDVSKLQAAQLHYLNTEQFEEWSQNTCFDAIIHCATSYNTDLNYMLETEETNVLLPLKLLMYAKNNKTVFINIGTILDEAISVYAASKKYFSKLLRFFSEEMCCVDVNLTQFYGPHDNEKRFCGYIISSLLNHVLKIEMTAGKQKRDFLYIEDAVAAISSITQHHLADKKGLFQYDVGTGVQTEMKDFAVLAKSLSNNVHTALNIGSLPYRENEIFQYELNLAPLYSLGWSPQYTLETGLLKTFQLQSCVPKGKTTCAHI